MTARIIDGNALSAKLRGELAAKAAELTAKGTQPCLAVILVGGDPASAVPRWIGYALLAGAIWYFWF